MAMALGVLAASVSPAWATYTLSVSTFGPISISSVTSNPPGISCGSTCSAVFAASSTVELTAFTAPDMAFAGWGGPAGCENNSSPCKVVMDSNQSITAQYDPTLSVFIFNNGAGEIVDSSGNVNCNYTNTCQLGLTASYPYYPGSKVTLYAIPLDTATVFVTWTGAAFGCGSASTCTVTVSVSTSAGAEFSDAGPLKLTVGIAGTGKGTVTSSPPSIKCTSSCAAYFNASTVVTLTATPAPGYRFAGWSNANGACSGTGTCVITINTAQQSFFGPYSPVAWFY